jgi:hypothetical protein
MAFLLGATRWVAFGFFLHASAFFFASAFGLGWDAGWFDIPAVSFSGVDDG